MVHVTSVYNVEPSINKAYEDGLNAIITLPTWMVTPRIVYNWPEIAASTPCFSIIHFTGSSSDDYQGRSDADGNSTMRNTGLLEISAWVSRDQKYNGLEVWTARLRYMQSMLQQVHTKLSTVRVLDFENNPSSPAAAPFRVVISNMNEVQVANDENPSIRRKRFLINYHWHLRAE